MTCRSGHPAASGGVFGPALKTAEQYAALLAGPAVERGLLGPGEAARLWDRHLINCAVVAELVPAPCSLIDLGSGPGLPGIVFAMLLPDVSVTLLEPMARRVTFLEECVAELGLANTEVVRGRAEDMAGQLTADVVVARAVAPMEKLAGLALGLVKPGGLVLAIKGASAEDEVSRARSELRRLGARIARCGAGGEGGSTRRRPCRFPPQPGQLAEPVRPVRGRCPAVQRPGPGCLAPGGPTCQPAWRTPSGRGQRGTG